MRLPRPCQPVTSARRLWSRWGSAGWPWRPTVRAWAKRGILRVRRSKPRLLLVPASVLEVRQLVSELRAAGQTRDLLDEVYNRLADEQQLADPDLAESLGQMHRGEYIVRRQPTE